MKYIFKKKLVKGLIKSRPNRFIMNVLISGVIEKCHCPSTGKIGDVKFENVACLVSRAENPERKTKFTVEAFSLDRGKNWIGINQTRANEYVEFFLRTEQLKDIFKGVDEIKREAKLGKSRIDFLINNRDYLEVKTPLNMLLIKGREDHSKLTSFERLIKHFHDLSSGNGRIVLLMCYMYDAFEFKVPKPSKSEERIVRAAKKARSKGLENWQINLKIDETGVELLNYFKLNLF